MTCTAPTLLPGMCFPLDESKLAKPINFIISFSSSVFPSRSLAVIGGRSKRNLGSAPGVSTFSLRSLLLDLRLGERDRLLGDLLRRRRGERLRSLGDKERDRLLCRSLGSLRSRSRSRCGSRRASRSRDLPLSRSLLSGERDRLRPMLQQNNSSAISAFTVEA